MTQPRRAVKGLGEVTLRVTDLGAMQRFYEEVVGLELLRRFEHAAFFRLAEGHGGHAQVLALFDRSAEPGYAGLNEKATTVDHFAFEIDLTDYEAEKKRLGGLGLEVHTAEHAWVGWRSLYFQDPEGHTVEFVCHDPAVR